MHEYLSKLISFDTTSGSGKDICECLDWLENFFSENFLYTHRVEHNGFESLIATTRPTKSPQIMLQAHLDVVPGSKKLFKLTSGDGKLYGRGTFDMKFAIAIYMQIILDIKESLADYDIGFMITTDEELGGEFGVQKLLEEYSTEVCIIPDGGDNWCLEKVAKGFYSIEATANGVTAHGSRPWEGENAIEKILMFIETLKAVFNDAHAETDTLTVSQISGGAALNQVPEHATVMLDIRTISTQSHESIRKQLVKAADLHDVNLSIELESKPLLVDLENTYVKNFIACTQSVLGTPMEPCVSLGASDARFFAAKNVPTIVMRPSGGGAHSEHEWIKHDDLETYRTVLMKFLNSYSHKQ